MNIYRHKQHGFTLLELLTVIVIVAVLVGMGAPALKGYLINNKLTAKTNSMVAALNLARGESITRSSLGLARVTAGKLSSSGGAWAASGGWDAGWFTWRDKDGDNAVDVNFIDDVAQELLKPVDGDATVKVTVEVVAADGSAQAINEVRYRASGQAEFFNNGVRFAGTARITLCNPDKNADGRLIAISRTGRVSLENARYQDCP